MAGSVGGRQQVAEVFAKTAQELVTKGWVLDRVQHDHVSTASFGRALEIRNPNVRLDRYIVIFLSKEAHTIKAKASKKIYMFSYQKGAPLI